MPTNLQPLERVARRVVALLLLHFVIAEPAAAQQLSGRVTQSDGTPAAGVQLVATRAADDAVVARVLTSATGSFRLSPSVPSARVRVRALRIGYRPADLGEFALPASGISGLHLELPDDRFRLTPVNAIATQRCEAVPDAGDALVELFGDVRQALNAIGLSAKAPDVPGARAVMSDVMTDTCGRGRERPVRAGSLCGRLDQARSAGRHRHEQAVRHRHRPADRGRRRGGRAPSRRGRCAAH
jgi:hypothetical protein